MEIPLTANPAERESCKLGNPAKQGIWEMLSIDQSGGTTLKDYQDASSANIMRHDQADSDIVTA